MAGLRAVELAQHATWDTSCRVHAVNIAEMLRLNTHLLQLAQGYVMLCVAYPTGDCVIDTHQYSDL